MFRKLRICYSVRQQLPFHVGEGSAMRRMSRKWYGTGINQQFFNYSS